MKYKVTHTTKYSYTEPVAVCHNQVHLAPRNSDRQSCDQYRLAVHPTPAGRRKRGDYFGNRVDYFSIHEAHRGLTVTAASRIEVVPGDPPQPKATAAWEDVVQGLRGESTAESIEAYQFAFNSPSVRTSEKLAAYARESFMPRRPILDAARELTSRIHADFRYDPKATTVHTPLDVVFRDRRGVCQDFAHVQIGCLRSLGLGARYVSGYLRTFPPAGQPRLIGADASHAWLSIYCGADGWIDLDPTNDVIPAVNHLTVAWGRDYGDVCPIQGVFLGGGQHTMSVSVDVSPLAPEEA